MTEMQRLHETHRQVKGGEVLAQLFFCCKLVANIDMIYNVVAKTFMQFYPPPKPHTPFQYASEVNISMYLKCYYTFRYKQRATCSGTYTVHFVDYFSVRSVDNGNESTRTVPICYT